MRENTSKQTTNAQLSQSAIGESEYINSSTKTAINGNRGNRHSNLCHLHNLNILDKTRLYNTTIGDI